MRPAHLIALCIALSGAAAGVRATGTANATAPGGVSLAPYTNESETQTFTVNEDGSFTKLDTLTLRVNTEAGIARAGQYYVWFNREMADVDILDAWTEDTQGHRHDVRPEQIRDVQELGSFDAPMFQDVQDKVIVFPAVEPGARVHLTYRKTQRVPVVPGWFSDFTPPDLAPTHNFRVIYDMPASEPLYADARGFTALPPQTSGGRTRYEFRYDKASFERLEYGSVSYVSYGDRLMVSTFPDYAAFASVYRASAADPSAHDAALVAFAKRLTDHDTTPRAKAQTLYDWVRRNIRYVAINIGRGEIVPHHAADVLANRYGDCKDHVALYGALLAAVGVKSEPALINSGTVYTLPDVPGFGVINHVITWLPDLQMFADSTAGNIEFGFLPATDMDRTAVLAGDGTRVRTPATASTTRESDLDITVAPDGSARFTFRLHADGWAAEQTRSVLRLQTPAQREESLQWELRNANLRGTATIATSPLDATSGPLVLTLTGQLDGFLDPGMTTPVPALTSFVGGLDANLRYWLGEPRRTQPFVCRNFVSTERTRIALPPGIRVLDVPAPQHAENAYVEFSSQYALDPATNVLRVTRTGRTHFASDVCTPDEFAQMRPAFETMSRDLRAQWIVKPMENATAATSATAATAAAAASTQPVHAANTPVNAQ
jgi:transglutaminase-like putative cysteine protease